MDIKFWKDKDKKILSPDLFSDRAESLAKAVFEEGSNKINKPTQIRKFYNEVVRFHSMVKTKPSEFDIILPYLMMLNAKAAYAEGRDLISRRFKDFISSSLKQVKDRDDLDAFAGLFESFMGYYKFYDVKGHRPSRGGAR